MAISPNLELPLILPSQAQKHVTHNEALVILDAVVQLAVADRDLNEPPGGEAEGDRFIVASGATGAWAGRDGRIALFQDGGWTFLTPLPGWIAWVVDEAALVFWTGAAWTDFTDGVAVLQNLSLLGIGTTADASNPFSAKLNKALWTALTAGEGGDGDLRYTLNKEGASSVLSLLMQSNWSGRAELGLIGDDNLTLKVSPDGLAWTTALSIDRTTGRATLAADPATALGAATRQYADGKVARTGDTMSGNLSLSPGRVGVGTAAPGYAAHAVGAGFEASTIAAERVAESAASPTFLGIKGRGAVGAPAPVLANDSLFRLMGYGYFSGSATHGGGAVEMLAAEDWSSGNRGATISFATTPLAGTSRATRMTIAADGGVGIGTASPADLLHVAGNVRSTGNFNISGNAVIDQNRHHRLRAYTVATLPSAAPAGQMVHVSDGSSNRPLAVSDGTSWRFPDGNVVT